MHHTHWYNWVLDVTDPSRTRHALPGSITTHGTTAPLALNAFGRRHDANEWSPSFR